MSITTRLVAFVVALAAVFGLAFFVGGLTDVDVDVDDEHADMADDGHGGHDASDASDGPDGDRGKGNPAAGYRVALQDTKLDPGRSELAFTVEHRGRPVTAYDLQHEKPLHLIVVSRDLQRFQHVHPELGEDAVWRVPLELGPGSYRLFADLKPTGAEPMVVERELAVMGSHPGPSLERSERTTNRVDGYDVRLTRTDAGVRLSISRDGEPVDDLQPYLGAYGHLVAIRAGSLDYVHVHPEDGPAGPDVAFGVEFAKPGVHRLFLDFRHDGRVRTADFTLVEGQGGGGHDH